LQQPSADQITAVILAGGRGRRLGGLDKGLLQRDGKTLVEQMITAIKPQVQNVLINANRNHDRYREFGAELCSDSLDGFQGPLAGFATGMAHSKTDYIITVPCDTPSLPPDYVQRMCQVLIDEQAEIAVAHDGQRMQPVYALIPCTLQDSLARFLAAGERKIDIWYARHSVALVDFSDVREHFFNINTQTDRQRLDSDQPAS
jgi:molybdenum cofactor guanylyltransferase